MWFVRTTKAQTLRSSFVSQRETSWQRLRTNNLYSPRVCACVFTVCSMCSSFSLPAFSTSSEEQYTESGSTPFSQLSRSGHASFLICSISCRIKSGNPVTTVNRGSLWLASEEAASWKQDCDAVFLFAKLRRTRCLERWTILEHQENKALMIIG